MSVPDFETIMRPLLVYLSDGREKNSEDTLEGLSREFRLTDEERRQLLPSGRQNQFRNRVAWAKFYLKKAGAVEATKRGVYRITERGKSLLSSSSGRIDVQVLQQYPEFREFLLGSRKAVEPSEPTIGPTRAPSTTTEPVQPKLTPEELIALGHGQLALQLGAELIEKIKSSSPDFFERLVVDLLLALGYGGSRQDAGQIVGRSGDEGIDGLIKEDRLGLETIYVQAKRWDGLVGRPELQKFAGALQGQRARKGIFNTTSAFTKEAQSYASSIESKIVLIDGTLLTRLMIEHNVGVTKVASYDIKRMDSDCFTDE